jgi:hypothetical protein
MIRELFLYLTTKVRPEAKTFGHLYEAIAIREREKRCSNFWKSHRQESKKLILEVVNSIKQKNALLILGSGPMHEIPIEELSKLFLNISLVDIVHLPETKKKYQHLKNLNFIEHDITELENSISKEKIILNQVPSAFLENKYDMVISANILSQLAYHLREYLEKKSSNILSPEKLDLFSEQISIDHISYLKKFICPVLLITDIETHHIDKSGKNVGLQTPYINFAFPNPIRTWDWNVAPIPEYSREISLQMKVAGFILNQ